MAQILIHSAVEKGFSLVNTATQRETEETTKEAKNECVMKTTWKAALDLQLPSFSVCEHVTSLEDFSHHKFPHACGGRLNLPGDYRVLEESCVESLSELCSLL